MKKEFLKNFWIFIIGSVAGFLIEAIYRSYRAGDLRFTQGVIYGPFIPIYGVGVLVFAYAATKMKKNEKLILFNCAVLGGIVEYIFSFLQELIFSTKSWDYSQRFLNINGRTSLFHVFWWGVLGFLFVKYLFPRIENFFKKVDYKKIEVFSIIAIILMGYNIFISIAACIRQEQRRDNVESTSVFQEYLDNTYPDEMLDDIFLSKRPAKK